MAPAGNKADSGDDCGLGSSRDRKRKRKKSPSPAESVDSVTPQSTSGCVVCGKDDDKSNILLCDGCNGEYHTYCLNPILKKIPDNDWYCDRCQPKDEGDGLEQLVSALPEEYVQRFGEIVWAQGGNGYGWWPSCIFDPRLTIGNTRDLASKNLGRRHLVYFFECDEEPFSVMHTSKIQDWTTGLVDSLYLGKAARATGKERYVRFRQAHQAAILEASKPRDERLQWNQLGGPPPSPTKTLTSPVKKRKKKKQKKKTIKKSTPAKIKTNDTELPVKLSNVPSESGLVELNFRGGRPNSAFQHVDSPRKELFCSVNHRVGADTLTNIGFVKVSSRQDSTFAQVRQAILNELDEAFPPDWDWRFFVPPLGRVSLKQESSFGAMIPFLRSAVKGEIGQGTIDSPIVVQLVSSSEALDSFAASS